MKEKVEFILFFQIDPPFSPAGQLLLTIEEESHPEVGGGGGESWPTQERQTVREHCHILSMSYGGNRSNRKIVRGIGWASNNCHHYIDKVRLSEHVLSVDRDCSVA